MKIAGIVMTAIAALTLAGGGLATESAQADQTVTGTVTKVDRLNGVIGVQRIQSGTVGANTGGAAEEFKTQSGLSLDTVHAGDRVTFSATESGGAKVITKFQKQ
jgi:Cu/Ag efflux protein CusF